jgi:hypothetical protein
VLALTADDFRSRLFELRVSGWHVEGLEECFLRHLPVGGHRNRLPPVVMHVGQCQSFDDVLDRCDELLEGLRVSVEVDEHEAGPDRDFYLFEPHIAGLQLAIAKLLTLEHELILAEQIPAPAVKRTQDL